MVPKPENLCNLLARPVVEEQALHVVGLAAPRHLEEIALAVVLIAKNLK